MAFGSDWERDLNRRMQEMSKKMDSKFAKFAREIDKPAKPSKPKPRFDPPAGSSQMDRISKYITTDGATVYVDGETIKIDNAMNIVVKGPVDRLEVTNPDKVVVEGSVKNLKNQNGDVQCKQSHGEIFNQNGDIKIDSFSGVGKVTAKNGDVKVKHQITSTAGPINESIFIPDFYKATVKAHLTNGGTISSFKQTDASRSGEAGERIELITEDKELDWHKYFYMIVQNEKQNSRTKHSKCYIKD